MTARKHEAHMSNDERLAVLETTILNINTTLTDMNRRFDKVEERFNKIDEKFDHLQNRMWSNFLWLMGMMIGLAGLIAHTQHWI